MKYPYFRFSGEKGGKESLETWLSHFETLGIPAAIVSHKGVWSLWRMGEEAVSGKIIPNREPIHGGVIVQECLGFAEKIGMAA